MSKRMVWVMLAVAVGTGLVVARNLYQRLSRAPQSVTQAPEEIPVVVAKEALARGTTLGAGHLETSLETVTRLRSEMPAGIFTQTQSLIGRKVQEEIPAGAPVLETSLAPREIVSLTGLERKVPAGHRAVGVFVDLRGGIQQFLRAGDRVDVIVTVEDQTVTSATGGESFQSRTSAWSKVLLQNVEVLDVPGDESRDRAETARESTSFRADTGKERLPVVLAMTPTDAERVSLAMKIGTIQLIKRGVSDDDITPTAGATQDTLFAAHAKQVLIEVRFAEVNRTHSRDLGLDYILQDKDWTQSRFLAGALTPQVPTTPNFQRVESTVKDVALSSAVNQLFEWRKGGPDVTAALMALEKQGLLRTLAAPNLLALSGESASFLAGGEFPIPVVQASAGTTASSSVTIEFKEFGIRLLFKPQVMSEEEIRLFVAPEVSVLDTGSSSVQISGFSIPSLVTRRASTTVQLRSGESLVIGGLLSQIDTKTNRQIPYLGNIPILGKLFSSEQFKNEETELLVVVTPRLVKPTPMAVTQPFSDPQAVEESLKQQVGPPPYPNAQGEALRGNFVPAPAPMSPSSQAPATPAAEPSAMGEGAQAESQSVTAQAAAPHSASADDTLVPQADTPQTETPHAERPDTDAPSVEAAPVPAAEERAEAQPQDMVVAQAVSVAGADEPDGSVTQ